MPVPGSIQTVTPGVTTPLAAPISPSVNQRWTVEVDNLSPWPLLVDVAGRVLNLAPGMAQLYASSGGPATVNVTALSPANASGSYQVLTNWAIYPDSIPGTFPTVIAPSLTAGLVYSTTTLANNTPVASTAPSLTIPTVPGQPYLLFDFVNMASASIKWLVQIVGFPSGIVYDVFNFKTPHGGANYSEKFWTLVYSAIDTAVTVNVQQFGAAGAWTVNLNVVASAAPPPFPNPTGPLFNVGAQGAASPVNFALPTSSANTFIEVWTAIVAWQGVTTGGNISMGTSTVDGSSTQLGVLVGPGAGQQTASYAEPFPVFVGGGNLQISWTTVGGVVGGNISFSYLVY